jgi:hypothetical protein
MTQEWFGELRSLIQPPGTEGKWRQICELLADPEIELEREQWWDYVAEHLDRHWPDEALQVPEPLVERIWRGVPLPAVAGLSCTLDLSHKDLADKQARMIALCAQLNNLTALRLDMNALGPDGVRVLVASPHLRQLTTLSLARNRLELPALKMMLGMWRLSAVHTLDLSGNLVGDEGAKLLASSPALANLTSLDLSSCRIQDEGALALARSPHLKHLTHLALGWNTFSGGVLRVLDALPFAVDTRGNDTDAPMIGADAAMSVARRAGEADELRRSVRDRLGLGHHEEDEEYDDVME